MLKFLSRFAIDIPCWNPSPTNPPANLPSSLWLRRHLRHREQCVLKKLKKESYFLKRSSNALRASLGAATGALAVGAACEAPEGDVSFSTVVRN